MTEHDAARRGAGVPADRGRRSDRRSGVDRRLRPTSAASWWPRRKTDRTAVLVVVATLIGVAGSLLGLGPRRALVVAVACTSLPFARRLIRLIDDARHGGLRDPLTGLANRALLVRHLRRTLHRARRRGEDVAVLFIDVDRFKTVNDSMGHAAGDRVLCAVAERMLANVRRSDLCARYAGDEFVIVLHPATEATSVIIAERLTALFTAPIWFDNLPVSTSASIGVALAVKGAMEADELIRAADTAMFCAKEHRNAYQVYNDEMTSARYGKLALQRALEKSASHRFHVHYQPVIDVHTNAIVAFEALVRWEDVDGQVVLPAGFMEVAEETGAIEEIGAIVLRKACEFIASWNVRHASSTAVFVNLSHRELIAPAILERVEAALETSHLEPSLLHLEVRERSLADAVAEEALKGLDTLGVQIDLADFGTSTSALLRISTGRFKTIKLDRSLIANIAQNDGAQAVLRLIVQLASELGLQVVAEGVEDLDDLEAMHALGCHLAQGFLIGRPRPATTWLPANLSLPVPQPTEG